jgi:endonuclease I
MINLLNIFVMKTVCFMKNYLIMNCSISIIKKTIILDTRVPSLYLGKNTNVLNNNANKMYSIEHIYPRSLLNKQHQNDMHNLFRTSDYLNNMRSNYKFTDKEEQKQLNNNWIKLEYFNYVNKKDKLFIPNDISKGIIARSLMYLSYTYNYNPYKVISPSNLVKWSEENPPDDKEIFHNKISKLMQENDNRFISEYDGKFYKNAIKNLF